MFCWIVKLSNMLYDERLSPEMAEDQVIYNEHQVRYELAVALIQDLDSEAVVIDCACGEGYGVKHLAETGRKIIGIDISEEVIKTASVKYQADNLSFQVDSAEKLATVKDSTVDVVISFETIEHLPNYEAYLANVGRVLKTTGYAVISTPNKAVFGAKNPFHVREFNKQEFVEVLGKYFKQVKVYEQFNGLASWIAGEGEGKAIVSSPSKPYYFLAVVSQSELPKMPGTVMSGNGLAYERRENNPAWKLINKVYSIVRKFV